MFNTITISLRQTFSRTMYKNVSFYFEHNRSKSPSLRHSITPFISLTPASVRPYVIFDAPLFPSSSITLSVFSFEVYERWIWKLFVTAVIPLYAQDNRIHPPQGVTLPFCPLFLSLFPFVSPLARFKGHSFGIVSAALPLIFKRRWLFVELLWAKPHPNALCLFLSLVHLLLSLSLALTISPGFGPSWPVTHIDWPCRRSLRMRDGEKARKQEEMRAKEKERERGRKRQTAGPTGCKAQGQK